MCMWATWRSERENLWSPCEASGHRCWKWRYCSAALGRMSNMLWLCCCSRAVPILQCRKGWSCSRCHGAVAMARWNDFICSPSKNINSIHKPSGPISNVVGDLFYLKGASKGPFVGPLVWKDQLHFQMYYDIRILGRLFGANRRTWSNYTAYIKSFGSRDAFALISCFWTILAACGPRHESRLGDDHVIKAKWSGHCSNPNRMYLGELFIYALDCQGWSHRMVYDGDAEGT